MCRFLFFLTSALLACLASASAQDADTFAIQIGQAWTFDAAEEQQSARMIIGKIEEHESFGSIVHVSLVNVSTKHPETGDQTFLSIMHMPFTQEAVEYSARKLDGDSDPPPQFTDALAYWSRVKGGVWTISVGTALTEVLLAAEAGDPSAINVR